MTTFDVLGGVELTLSSAIMIAVLSIVIGRNVPQRLKYAAVLLMWFVVVFTLAVTGALQYPHGLGTPGLGLAVGLPVVLIWLAMMRVLSVRNGLDHAPMVPLVAAHTVRILGFSFLVLHAANRLPAPFAPMAGWGDIIAGIAAAPVAWMVYRQTHGWRVALVAWNIFGLADLMTAVSLGVLSSPGPLQRIFTEPGTGLMTTLPWLLIPAYLVPLLGITHVAIFYRLAQSMCRGANPSIPNSITAGG
jgi:hypothetical protein